ncbi:MAG: methyltransferase domain-containing protein [Gemmatimonadales bacterium]|nr:MAG: methyltransferase domain-containing protein [Gemmatimonadales bacterium]
MTEWAAARYDHRWGAYTEATLAPLMDHLERAPPPPEVRVLDIGCGTGVLLERVASACGIARLAGIDPSAAMLGVAARRLREAGHGEAGLVQGASAAIPFASASFDLVVSSSSLHFWPDPGAGLLEIARVLGPGGRLVLMDWSGDALGMRLLGYWLRARDPRHQRVLGSRELGALLDGAGYRVSRVRPVRSHGLWRHLLVDAVVVDAPG